MTAQTFNMAVETAEGVKPHGFHLGTDMAMAEKCVFEALRRPGVRSVALYLGPCASPLAPGAKPVGIYDWRDLPETPDDVLLELADQKYEAQMADMRGE